VSPLFRNQRTPDAALWQARVRVASYREKVSALGRMIDFARRAGLRSSLRERVRVSADELMMNALYHAPTDSRGRERYRSKVPRELAQCAQLEAIELRYGCDAKQFSLSVRDEFGSLSAERARSCLRRADGARRPIEGREDGAGLGLLHVQRAATEVIFHLAAGESTEIVAFFSRDGARQKAVHHAT
jgi:hypothetical protein